MENAKEKEVSEAEKVMRGRLFLQKLIEFSKDQTVKGAVTIVKISAENKHLFKIANLNPKGAGIVLTSVTVRKAMHAAGLGTNEDAMKCVIAVGKLGGTLGIAAVLAPTGVGAVAAVAAAALEGYEVGNSCFQNDKGVAYSIKAAGI